MTTLIDAHGGDHGLRVTLDLEAREVEITQWAELCEPDENGDRHPHLHHTTMTLRHCLEAAQDSGRRGHKSQHDRVITGALRALFLYGGEEEGQDEDSLPCDVFGYDPKVPCSHCENS